jgi:hypothetical protein
MSCRGFRRNRAASLVRGWHTPCVSHWVCPGTTGDETPAPGVESLHNGWKLHGPAVGGEVRLKPNPDARFPTRRRPGRHTGSLDDQDGPGYRRGETMIDARRRHELRDRVDARRAEAQALRHAVRDPFLRKLLSRGLAVLNEIDRLFLGPVDTTRSAEVEATWLTAAEKRYAIASAMITRVQEDGTARVVGDDFPTACASVGESPNDTRGGSQDDLDLRDVQ